MQILFRAFFILVLLSSALAASVFMVLESAEFFGRFYPEERINFGLWGAALNELFLAIMAAVWLPAIDWNDRKIFHPGNLLIKALVILLFINTVGGATLNVAQQKFDKLQEQENRIRVLRIRRSQIEDHQKNLDTFTNQKQVTLAS